MDWLYVLPDAGKRTTPDMTAAFTRTIHDCESAARKKHYRGYKRMLGNKRTDCNVGRICVGN